MEQPSTNSDDRTPVAAPESVAPVSFPRRLGCEELT
jgi:hypothetical protein